MSPVSTPNLNCIDDFGTILECMDGRPQRKVGDYLTTSFGVRHLDTITTAGIVRHLAEDTPQTAMLLANLDISIAKHGSHQVAVVAHHDCAGNQVSDGTQKQQIAEAVTRIADLYPDVDVVGLWLNEHLIVERVRAS